MYALSSNSTKQELLNYLTDHYRPLQCPNQNHKFIFSDICLGPPDESKADSHQIYQLLCHDCKLKNSFLCTGKKHKTVELIETIKHLIEQTYQPILKPDLNAVLSQPSRDNEEQFIIQAVQNIKAALADMKKAEFMLREQITKLETQKLYYEQQIQNKYHQINECLGNLKELLVQILQQDHSQYFQQYISNLKDYTYVDQNGEISICLEKLKKKDIVLESDQSKQLKQMQQSVKQWIKILRSLPTLNSQEQNQFQSEISAAFSYLLNQHQMDSDLKLLLVDVDKLNQQAFKMKPVYSSDLHKKQCSISTPDQCTTIIQKIESSNNLTSEYMALVKFLSGFCQLYGIGYRQDEVAAFKMFCQSNVSLEETSGYAVAQNFIGQCYSSGTGIEKDSAQAVSYFRMAADQGFASGQKNLGECYQNGEGVKKDLVQALKYIKLAAQQGNASAQNILGNCYYYGEGVEKDLVQAVKYYRAAAVQGYKDALFNIGCCYYKGAGVEKNLTQAVQYFQAAADRGHANAQNSLGYCYFNGEGIQKDIQQAVFNYEKAAKQGHTAAQFNLGCYYQNDDQNLGLAVQYYRMAAGKGHAGAQNSLGYCYKFGRGVALDFAEAVKYYKLAANQGYANAQFNLGNCYMIGEGVEKNITEARKLYQQAAEQGLEQAIKALQDFK